MICFFRGEVIAQYKSENCCNLQLTSEKEKCLHPHCLNLGCIHLLNTCEYCDNTRKYCGNTYKYWPNTWKMCSPTRAIFSSIVTILVSFEAWGRSLIWNWLLNVDSYRKPLQVLVQYLWVLPQYLWVLSQCLQVLSRWIHPKTSIRKSIAIYSCGTA